jgi:diguanylate cyclase (GGDEF)-like protein
LSPLTDHVPLSATIASTATLKLARIPESDFFYTPLEERFERITRLARKALNVPVAGVTLLSADKQWFKSIAGWNVSELPLDKSLCAMTIQHGQTSIVEDTHEDPRTERHALVTSGPRFRFYAGQPLHDQENSIIGTFCVFDVKPRTFSASDRQSLADLAAMSQRELVTDQLRDVHTALTTKLSIARREAMMDHMTRLWNRRGASVLLKAACDEADRSGADLAVALLDFDNFKRINDTHGHQVGDEVLRRIASRLVGNIRSNDVTCRIGGDEFLLLMANTNAETAARVAERVRHSVTESPIPTSQGSIPMSISVGFTIRKPKEVVTVDQLIERADQGLMASKSAGRNRVRTTG